MPTLPALVSKAPVTPAPSCEELYSKYGAMVLRRARAMLGDEQAARDATQEIFIRVLGAWADFRARASAIGESLTGIRKHRCRSERPSTPAPCY